MKIPSHLVKETPANAVQKSEVAMQVPVADQTGKALIGVGKAITSSAQEIPNALSRIKSLDEKIDGLNKKNNLDYLDADHIKYQGETDVLVSNVRTLKEKQSIQFERDNSYFASKEVIDRFTPEVVAEYHRGQAPNRARRDVKIVNNYRAGVLKQSKEIFKTRIDSLRESGDRVGADLLTQQAVENLILSEGDSVEVFKQNLEKSNWFMATAESRANPVSVKQAINEGLYDSLLNADQLKKYKRVNRSDITRITEEKMSPVYEAEQKMLDDGDFTDIGAVDKFVAFATKVLADNELDPKAELSMRKNIKSYEKGIVPEIRENQLLYVNNIIKNSNDTEALLDAIGSVSKDRTINDSYRDFALKELNSKLDPKAESKTIKTDYGKRQYFMLFDNPKNSKGVVGPSQFDKIVEKYNNYSFETDTYGVDEKFSSAESKNAFMKYNIKREIIEAINGSNNAREAQDAVNAIIEPFVDAGERGEAYQQTMEHLQKYMYKKMSNREDTFGSQQRKNLQQKISDAKKTDIQSRAKEKEVKVFSKKRDDIAVPVSLF